MIVGVHQLSLRLGSLIKTGTERQKVLNKWETRGRGPLTKKKRAIFRRTGVQSDEPGDNRARLKIGRSSRAKMRKEPLKSNFSPQKEAFS